MKNDEALRIAVEALEFYAERIAYFRKVEPRLASGFIETKDGPGGWSEIEIKATTEMLQDQGQRARNTLAAIKLAQERAQEARKHETGSEERGTREIANQLVEDFEQEIAVLVPTDCLNDLEDAIEGALEAERSRQPPAPGPSPACGEFPSEQEVRDAINDCACKNGIHYPNELRLIAMGFHACIAHQAERLKSRLQAPGPAQPRSGE